MRRTTRRALTNLILFGGALLLIIGFSVHGTSSKTYAWSTVKYRTTASTLPKAHGTCPGLADADKPALVVSRVASDGDSKWVRNLADKYHICIYDVDGSINGDPTQLRVPANRGHEAMAYLTFLIDNYVSIPAQGAVFVHGSRWAWHNDSPEYDNANLLAALNTTSALAPAGYHNLRCDWSASTCPADSQPQGSIEMSLTAKLEPFNARVVSDAAIPRALANLFGDGSSNSPASDVQPGRADTIKSQCCAQFAVARSNIWKHSQAEYAAVRQWLLDDGPNSAPRDDRISGRILSYVWHILFLPPRQFAPRPAAGVHEKVELDRLNELACPSAADCYCRLYGRCGLKGCTEGSCLGQYVLPKDYTLPDDWASTHGGRVDTEHDGLKNRR